MFSISRPVRRLKKLFRMPARSANADRVFLAAAGASVAWGQQTSP